MPDPGTALDGVFADEWEPLGTATQAAVDGDLDRDGTS